MNKASDARTTATFSLLAQKDAKREYKKIFKI